MADNRLWATDLLLPAPTREDVAKLWRALAERDAEIARLRAALADLRPEPTGLEYRGG